jgi:hypothetical protein
MNVAWSSSQGSALAWDLLAGSHSHRSTSESHSPYNPGGFRVDCPQNPRHITVAPLSQGPPGVQNPWVPFSEVYLDVTFLRQPLPENNSTTMATKKRKALVIGIDYFQHPDPDFELRYCTRDAYEMECFLNSMVLPLKLA